MTTVTANASTMYHFHGLTLRDGRRLPPIGVKLVHTGPLVMCESGLHASPRIIDALEYAPGHILDGVILSGERIDDHDKSVARERTRVWSLDAETLLREFACWAALQVVHLWDAPPIVVEYLTTGDVIIADAARAALCIWYAARRGLFAAAPDMLTVGIRDAYRAGLTLALPTGPSELGWAMEDE